MLGFVGREGACWGYVGRGGGHAGVCREGRGACRGM